MRKLILIAVIVSAGVGCGALVPKTTETLDESVRSYNEGVLWQRYANAAIHVPPKLRAQFVDDWDQRSKDLKITSYDVVKVENKGSKEAHVQIKLEWYKDSEGVVHETHAVQTWERRDKLWIIVDESRLRGTEMPGLPEPLMKD